MQIKPFFPDQTYVYLDADGSASQIAGGAAFWSMPRKEIEKFGKGWLVSEYVFENDWENWEMHPEADEYVYLLSGEVEIHLDDGNKIRIVTLREHGAVLIPRGVWHTAKVIVPSRMLHVTMGLGTEHRPA